jgi:mono/diheme cytochrome c family protein
VPKFLIYGMLGLIVLSLIPPAAIARRRSVTTTQRRIHFVQDMDNQRKFRAQHANALFADGRAMRPLVEGTVARGELAEDDHYERGVTGEQWATTFPARVTLDMALVRRGRERFDIYCTPCHGSAGYGDGIVNQRAMELVNTGTNGTTWVQPKSVHEAEIRDQPVGQLYNTITNGVRNMAGYASQIPVHDRWAIVAYVRALQRSQSARPSDVPDADTLELRITDVEVEGEGDS